MKVELDFYCKVIILGDQISILTLLFEQLNAFICFLFLLPKIPSHTLSPISLQDLTFLDLVIGKIYSVYKMDFLY